MRGGRLRGHRRNSSFFKKEAAVFGIGRRVFGIGSRSLQVVFSKCSCGERVVFGLDLVVSSSRGWREYISGRKGSECRALCEGDLLISAGMTALLLLQVRIDKECLPVVESSKKLFSR